MTAGRPFLAALALVSVMTGGCSEEPVILECRRHDIAAAAKQGSSTAFVVEVSGQSLDDVRDHMDVGITVLRPVVAPITFVHVLDDREVERWDFQLPEAAHPVVLCRASPEKTRSSCGVSLTKVPHPLRGYYYLLPNGNRVVEASLSFWLCG